MIKYLLFILILLSLITGCSKIEYSEISPEISFIIKGGFVYSDTSLNPGKQYNVGIIATSENGENLTNLIVTSNGQRILDKGFNLPEINEEIVLTKTIDDTEIIRFIIINKARKRDTISISIKKMNNSYSHISKFKSDLIGAQNNVSYGNYFSFANGNTYTQSQAFNNQQLIDLVYYFDASGDENTLASPGANLSGIITGTDAPENWAIKRTTRFSREPIVVSDEEFNSANNDSLILAHLFTDGGRKAKQLKNGKYFGFQNNENKYGILKIENVTGQAEGTLQISVIIQQ